MLLSACRLMLGKKHATTEPDMTGSNNFWAKNNVVIESRNYKAVGPLDTYIYISTVYTLRLRTSRNLRCDGISFRISLHQDPRVRKPHSGGHPGFGCTLWSRSDQHLYLGELLYPHLHTPWYLKLWQGRMDMTFLFLENLDP